MQLKVTKKAGMYMMIFSNDDTYIIDQNIYTSASVVYFRVFSKSVTYCLGIYKLDESA